MALYTPRNVPLNWFRYKVTGEIELLSSYVEGIEQQVEKSVADFSTLSEQITEEPKSPEEPAEIVTVYQGLDDQSWDLHGIFYEHFPNLQRRSALICIFSVFENELNELCSLFMNTEQYRIAFKDIKGNGIDRARTYLTNIACVDLEKASTSWEELKNIQKIRNKFVHADGRIIEPGSEQDYINSTNYLCLNNNKEIIIQFGFLKYVLETFQDFCTNVDYSIKVKYQ